MQTPLAISWSEVKVTQSCPTLCDLVNYNSPGQNTEVGSFSFLQGIFPTQGSNSGLPNCRWILYQLNHKGSPRILEWVAFPFSSRSSQPRNQIRVSCIAGRFFPNWVFLYHFYASTWHRISWLHDSPSFTTPSLFPLFINKHPIIPLPGLRTSPHQILELKTQHQRSPSLKMPLLTSPSIVVFSSSSYPTLLWYISCWSNYYTDFYFIFF